MARPESVVPVNFARESNDLQVHQRAVLDETLGVLLDVFSTVIREGIVLGVGEDSMGERAGICRRSRARADDSVDDLENDA